MRVIVTGVHIPNTRGGAEVLNDSLIRELEKKGHNVRRFELPFVDQRKEALVETIKKWRETKFTLDDADLVIATKFPSYFIKHPRKSLWLVHQHRQMYELLGTRFSDFHPDEASEVLRRGIMRREKEAILECQVRACISDNVQDRLQRYLDVDSISLPPPLPLQGRYRSGDNGNYILSVGRLCSIKRVDLILKSLPLIHNPVRLKIVGAADEEGYEDYLRNEVAKHNLEKRVEFLGRVSDEELIELYSEAFVVFYGPFDEDYGFVTLEALKSRKPVVTCTDSGGVLAYIEDGTNGVIAQPTYDGVSRAVNKIYENDDLYRKLCAGAQKEIELSSWDKITEILLG